MNTKTVATKLLPLGLVAVLLLIFVSVAWAATTTYTFSPVNANTYRDEFASQAYNLNIGGLNWTNNWTELNDGATSPTAGQIQINNNQLRLRDDTAIAGLASISRTANLSGFPSAVLSFDFSQSNLENNDTVVVEISNNGGSSYTLLDTFSGSTGSGSREYTITSSIAANTTVRFRVTGGFTDNANEFFFVDNVQIRRACGDRFCAYESIVDQFPYTSAADQNSFIEATFSDYANIADPAANEWLTDDPGTNGDEVFVQFNMKITDTVSSINAIDLRFTGFTSGGSADHSIYVLRAGQNQFAAASWFRVGTTANFNASNTMTRTITSNFSDYIDSSGNIIWGVYTNSDNESVHISFVQMVVRTNIAPNTPTNPQAEGATNPANVSDTAPEFNWTFSDPDVGDTQGSFEVEVGTDTDWNNGAELWDSGQQTSSVSNTEYAGTTLLLDGATYFWRVRTWDNFNAVSPWTATQQFTMISNQAPVTPVNITPATNIFTTTQNPVFTWSAYSDPNGDPQVRSLLRLRSNPGAYGDASSKTSGDVANTTSSYASSGWNLTTGNYCWQVQVRDSVGLWSDFSTQTCFNVDRIAPTSAATSPAIDNAGTIDVDWTASDSVTGNSGIASVALWYKLNSGGTWTNSGLSQTGTSGTFAFNPPGGTNGTYFFQTVAVDVLGNTEAAAAGNGDSNTVYDTTPPSSQASPPAGPLNTAPIAVTWVSSATVSGVITNGVQLWVKTPGSPSFVASGLTQPSTTQMAPSGTFNYTPANGDGTYCFYTIATDNATNVEAAPAGANGDGCTIYKTQSNIGDLVWLDTNGDGIKDPGESGINGVSLTLRRGTTVLGTATTAGGGLYSFDNVQGPQTQTVRDEFGTNGNYGLNNGTANWAASWQESGESDGAGAGDLRVTGNQLRIETAGKSISRQVNLSNAANATLTFDVGGSGTLENSGGSIDTVVVEVSNNGGSSYTTLNPSGFSGNVSGTQSFPISAYLAANTIIRFRVLTGFTSNDEYFSIDNVQVQFEDTSLSTYTVTVDDSNFNVGGPLNGLSGTSASASPLLVSVSLGVDFSTADFGYGAFAAAGGRLYRADNNNNIPNITVRLYSDGNGNGRIDGSDAIFKTSTTGVNGRYNFGGLAAGSYTVLADVNDSDLPAAFRPVTPNPVAISNVVIGSNITNADIGFNLPSPVTKPLYLLGDSDTVTASNVQLSRNRPIASSSKTITLLSSDTIRDHSFTWPMTITQALAGPLTFVSGQQVQAILRIESKAAASALSCGGLLPDVTVTLGIVGGNDLGSATIFDMTEGTNTRIFNITIPAGTTIPANSRLRLKIDNTGADCGFNIPQDEDADGRITIYFSSLTDLSRVEIPALTYLKIDQDGTYDAAYPGGANTLDFTQGEPVYIRATASDPFGAFDISGMNISVPGIFTNTTMSQVATGSLTKTFEISLTGLLASNYSYTITATEGLEGQVTAVTTGTFRAIVSNLGNSSKIVDKATAVPGDVLTYTVILSNTGGLATTARMTDTLPANVTYLSGPTGPAGASYNVGLNAVLFNGSVPANGQTLVVYTVRVNTPLDNGTIIANSATISDTFNRFETSPTTTVIQSAPNLIQSTKSVAPAGLVAPGAALDYTIILTNTGNMNANIAQSSPVLDSIPVNTTFDGGLSASAGQIAYNPGFNRIEWYGIVPASGRVTLTYRARLVSVLDRGTVITNSAIIYEGTGFPTPQTYTRTITSTIQASPVLTNQSAKLVDKVVAAPGDTLFYTLRLVNTGNMNAPGVVLSDTLPSQINFITNTLSAVGGGVAEYFPITRTVVWQGDLSVGTTVQVFFQATINSPLANNTSINNLARVSDSLGNFTPFNMTVSTLVQSAPNLNGSTKTVNTATASPGDPLTYTIRLLNSGKAIANTSVVDTLPAQLQNPTILSVSGGTAQIIGGNVISWTGQVTPTEIVTITFRATLLPVLDNGTQVVNTAQINDGVNSPFLINPAAVTTIVSSPNLNTSRKIVDLATAAPNDLLVYTIILTNTGNMVGNAQVRDILPDNVTFNGSLSASPGAPLPTFSSVNKRITWQGSIVPGTPITVSYRVRINTPLDNGTIIENDAEINDGVHVPFDTTPPAQTVINSAPNLITSNKAVDLNIAEPGDLLHYTIEVVNTGNMIAAGVVLTDIIPTQVTFASGPFVSGGVPASYNGAARRVSWNGSVTPGTNVIIEYFVTVNSSLPSGTEIVNDAQIRGNFGTTTVTTNNTNAVTTTIQSHHELSVTKNAPSAVGAGQVMTYTIQYNVTGNEPATGVVITDIVPANTAFASCAGGTSCSQTAGLVTWNLGNLNPGSAGVVTLRVNVTSPLPNGTVITNTAVIFDTDDGLAESTATTNVTSGHGFSLTKRDTGFDPVQAGGQITYSIDWSVGGAETASGVIITDTVPLSTTYVSCGGATCSISGGVVTWSLGTQNPNAAGTVTMTVNVASPLPNGTIISNTARISDNNNGLATSSTEQTTVNSSHSLDVEKTGPTSVPAGGQITYAIAYTVPASSNEASQNLIIDDTTPPNTTFVSAGGATVIDNPGAGNTGLVRWHLNNRNPGSTGVVTMTVNVNSPLPTGTTINNTATIQDSNGGGTDVDTVSTSVTSGHTFNLTKTDTPDPAAPGGTINYTIHWEVTGNEAAQDLVITDIIPINTSYQSCGACVFLSDNSVRWELGTRNPGTAGDVFVQVQVNSPLPNGTVITNTARIFDSNNGTPRTSTVTTTVGSNHQLTLSKSAPSVVQAGQQINYTLNWAVTGNEMAPGIVITDRVPLSTTYNICSGGTSCSITAGVVTWVLGNHNPGDTGSVNLVVDVNNPLPNNTVISNTARIFDTSGRSAQASATTTVTSGHGFTLVKRDTGFDPAQAGSQITYSIDWSVVGAEVAQNVVVTDTLPVNVTFNSCTGGTCSQSSPGVVTWNLGNQSPNASGTVTVIVTVNSPLPNGTLITNQARIGDGNGGIVATTSEQTTINSSHSLLVRKVAPATANAGDQLTYTIFYTVTGTESAQNVVIEDTTPGNTTYASAAGATTINNPGAGGTGLVRWNLGNLGANATGSVTLVVDVASPLPNNTVINNTAFIRDGNNGATGQSAASTNIGSSHALGLTKTDSPDPVQAGGFINYTIHWSVTGNGPAQSVVVTDTIPANTTFSTCSGCSLQGSFVQWNLSTRNPGESGDVTLQVQVNSPLANGTTISNLARISDSNGGTPVTATTTTSVGSSHQLTLSKNAPSIVQAGQSINYTINWSVSGNEVAPNLVITDAVPANTTYSSCGGIGATCSEAGGVVTWNLGTRNPSESGSVSLVVTVGGVVPNGTTITNTARIFDTDGGVAQASASTNVSSGHGFSLVKRDTGFDPVQAGGQLVYSIDWSVSGSEAAQNMVISDTLPANTTFVGCNAPGGTCSAAGSVVTWNLGTRNPNTSGTVVVTTTVASPLANNTLLSNQARVGDSNGGLTATSNTEQTTVRSSHTLSVQKTAAATIAAGGRITYTIRYTVTGNEQAQNVVIEDTTPNNTTFAAASGAATIDSPGVGGTGLVSWRLGNLNPGTSGFVTLVVNVANVLPNNTAINNTVRILDGNNGATDQDTATTTVSTSHALTLSKTAPNEVAPNALINYTIHWTVTGNEPAQNVIISDTIPASTTLVFCGCAQLGSTLQWNLGSHNPGESGDVTLQVRVNPLTPNGTVITNTATIFDNNNGTTASATVTTTVRSSHNLTIDKVAPATVAVGQQIIYTINYGVTGDELAPDVVITDVIPANTQYENSCTNGCVFDTINNIISWNLGDLPPATQGQVQFVVRVNNGVPNGTEITNTVQIADSSNKTATDTTVTRVGTGLNINLVDNRNTVQPGERITYTISYSGTDPIQPGVLEIAIPANTTQVGASPGFIDNGTSIGWLILQPAGVTGQRYLVVQLLPVLDNGTIISTTATIAANSQSNLDSESAVVVSQPNLASSIKSVSNPGANPGDLVTYQIALTNTGNMHAHNTTITDVIPAQVVYQGGLASTSGTPSFNAGQVGWQGPVQVGTSVVISFTAQVSSTLNAGTIVENIADINDGVNPTFQRSAVIAVGNPAPRVGPVFLPLILNGVSVTTPTGPEIELTIRNCGDTNAVGAFWVDLYVNPNEQSSFWPISHGEGYNWFGRGAGFVVSTLGPGQSKSLYLSNALLKDLPNPLPASLKLYAQVDLFDKTTPDIGVVDEGPDGEANNVAGNGGSTCKATPGKADLIIQSIKYIPGSQAHSAVETEQSVEGVEPAPARLQAPQE